MPITGDAGDRACLAEEAFSKRIKTKAHEQFNLLMCDVGSCDLQQRLLLEAVLLEEGGHASAVRWRAFVQDAFGRFGDRRSQLQRLVNKALELVPDADNEDVLALHVYSAKLKSDDNASLKYFQTAVCKKDLFKNFASFYVEWSDVVRKTSSGGGDAAAAEILKKGLSNGAEPRALLVEHLSRLSGGCELLSSTATPSASISDVLVEDKTPAVVAAVKRGGRSMVMNRDDESSSQATTSSSDVSSSSDSNSDDGSTTKVDSLPAAPAQSTAVTAIASAAPLAPPPPASRLFSSTRGAAALTQARPTGKASSSSSTRAASATAAPKPSSGLLSLGSKCQRVVKGATASFSSSASYKEELKEENSDDEDRKPAADVARLPVKRKAESSDQSAAFDVSAVPTRETRGSATPKSKHQLTIEDEGGECDGDISMMTATVKLDAPTTASKTKKPDLSKYVDEKLLNFDPSSRRNMVKMLPKTFTMPAPQPQPQPQQAKTRSMSVLGSSALLSTSLSSVESDADTAPMDLSMGMSALQDSSSHPAASNSTSTTTGAPPPPPAYAAPVLPPDAGKGADKRKRVSFAQPGAADAALVEEAKKPKAQRADQPASEVALSGSFGNLKQLTLNNNSYLRLSVLGKGGSSCVHRVVNESGQVFAYKKVDVRGNEESDAVFDSYVNEIELLRRLKGSQHIIELVDAEINREEMYIAMVMEAGEVDLSKVLAQKQRKPIVVTASGKPAEQPQQQYELNPFFIRLIWHEMLEAVDHIHENRIVHGDLKPANFVFVRGHLKLIDFGIAKAFSNDTTNIYRESQIGTVNYMAPEAIAPFTDSSSKDKGVMRLGKPSDIWSLGCILYQIIYGRPPFAALNTIQKLHAIPNVKYEISYPASGDADAVESIQACLVRNPRQRTTIRGETGLLSRSFLTHSTKHRTDEVAKQSNTSSSAISLQHINSVVEAVVEELSSTLSSTPSAEDLDSLGIVVWSRLNSIKSSVIADRAQTIIPSSSMCGAKQAPARPPLSNIPLSFAQNQQQRLPTKDASPPEKHDTRSLLEGRINALRNFLTVDTDSKSVIHGDLI